uniref:BLOC-1-related complex subunit 5 n=1 Tax=Lotus japonicus TaxID=34305 RepID=I3TAF5_LOTJA|nr:unknown [Lotus japonicus]
MGASESTFSSAQTAGDKITTVSERLEVSDPILERLKSLKMTPPILTSPPQTEGSLTDILVRKPSSSSASATVNPKVLLELFSMYRDFQGEKVHEISKRQEEIENRIEVADALAIKLLQRFNHSMSTMKTASQHLSGVHSLQVEIGELKGRLAEVISNCDALCKRIEAEGPESLRSSIKPFALLRGGPRKVFKFT